MQDNTSNSPLFKKIDQAIFGQIDKFKQTPNYNGLQDFYNGLEEEQQRVFKGVVILGLFLLPTLLLGFFFWQNSNLKDDLQMRISMMNKANEILGQGQSLREVAPQIVSANPIDSQEMMTSRLSNLLTSVGIDLSKIQVSDFNSSMISSNSMRSEAQFAFNGLSTDELMNLFTTMIQGEKFRIQSVNIKRNDESNLLNGQFHAVHLSAVAPAPEEE